MTTLEPGVHEPEDAPWWEFTSDQDGIVVVVKQWMGEAARAFAREWSAGEEYVELDCTGMNLDGTVGHYVVVTGFPSTPLIYFTVTRGRQVPKPQP